MKSGSHPLLGPVSGPVPAHVSAVPALPFTAPSWVIPGTVAENAAFLQGRVAGMMVCCFEHAPRLSLALPATVQDLSVCVHLPVDLPWQAGGVAAGRAAARCLADAAHLLGTCWSAVLHMPPHGDSDRLAGFVRAWQDAGWSVSALRLENTLADTPDDLQRLLSAVPLDICLDVAHAVLAGWPLTGLCTTPCPASQAGLYPNLFSGVASRVAMIHWSAPVGARDAHAPLPQLPSPLVPVYQIIARRWPEVEDVIEVFDWQGVAASWPVLRRWREGKENGEKD